jgi:hypothetical protein
MLSYLNENNNFIYFLFRKNIIAEFNEIYFKINENIIYYDNSHINYICTEEKDNMVYTFHGFFKNNLFLIVIDTYDEKLKINIEHKDIYIISVEKTLKKIDENKSVWVIDIPNWKKINLEFYILPIRKYIFTNIGLNIEDYLRLYNIKIDNVQISYKNEKKERKKIKDYINKIL